MSTKNIKNNSEIDLFNFFIKLWNSKLIIFFFSFISIVASYLYFINSKPLYVYKIYYSLNIIDFENSVDDCYFRNNQGCYANNAVSRIHSKFMKDKDLSNYELAFDSIIYKNENKSKLDDLYKSLVLANDEFTKYLLLRSQKFIKILEKGLIEENISYLDDDENINTRISLANNDALVQYIEYEKILAQLNDGEKVFALSEPEKFEYPTRSNFIVLLILAFGPLLSLFIIFIKDNLKIFNQK